MNFILWGLLAYLAAQVAIAFAVSRFIRTEADYLVAGRRLGIGLASFSIFATWFGAETVIGSAGLIYENGLAGGSGDPFGYALCILILGAFFARKLWLRKYTTFGDFFRERYSPGVERLAAILIIPPSIIWAAAQVRAFGQIVSLASGIDVETAITLAAVFVIFYTVLGGLLADAWTDLIQGGVLILGLLLLGGALLLDGSLPAALAANDAARLSMTGGGEIPWYVVAEDWAIPVFGSLLAVELISRLLAARSAEVAQRACFVGGGMFLLVGLIPALIGLGGPWLVPGLEDPEQLIPALAQSRFGDVLFVIFAGALISAILSTVDSALLAAGAILSHNIVVPLRQGISERGKLLSARAAVFAFGVLAWLFAIHGGSIYELVQTASAFGSAGIFVVGAVGLFSRIGGPLAAYAAMLVGAGLWAAGELLELWPAPYIVSIIAAMASYVAVAWLESARTSRVAAAEGV